MLWLWLKICSVWAKAGRVHDTLGLEIVNLTTSEENSGI